MDTNQTMITREQFNQLDRKLDTIIHMLSQGQPTGKKVSVPDPANCETVNVKVLGTSGKSLKVCPVNSEVGDKVFGFVALSQIVKRDDREDYSILTIPKWLKTKLNETLIEGYAKLQAKTQPNILDQKVDEPTPPKSEVPTSAADQRLHNGVDEDDDDIPF